MQILELFFVFCPTVDFWSNQLIKNHPDKPILKIYKHEQTKKPIWRGQQMPLKVYKPIWKPNKPQTYLLEMYEK